MVTGKTNQSEIIIYDRRPDSGTRKLQVPSLHCRDISRSHSRKHRVLQFAQNFGAMHKSLTQEHEPYAKTGTLLRDHTTPGGPSHCWGHQQTHFWVVAPEILVTAQQLIPPTSENRRIAKGISAGFQEMIRGSCYCVGATCVPILCTEAVVLLT